jgi:hypothetical protein
MEDPWLLWAGEHLAPPAGEPLSPPRGAPASSARNPFLVRAEPVPPPRRAPFLLRAEPLSSSAPSPIPPPRRAPASSAPSPFRLLPGEPLPPRAGRAPASGRDLGDRERREKGAASPCLWPVTWATEKGGRRERRLGAGRRERRLGEGRRRERRLGLGEGRRERRLGLGEGRKKERHLGQPVKDLASPTPKRDPKRPKRRLKTNSNRSVSAV